MKEMNFKLLTVLILLVLVCLPLGYSFQAPPLPPTPPKNLTAECVNEKVALSWQPSTATEEHPVIWYYIYRGNSSENEKYLTKVSASITSYIDSNVKIGNTYYYYVTAVNDVGESNRSNEVNVTVEKVVNPPEPPRNLFAMRGDGYVMLQWKPPVYNGGAPIVSYNIYRNGKVLTTVSPSFVSYRDTSVNVKESYTYFVTAINEAGESKPSNEVTVKWTLPQPPGNLNLTESGSYIILTWVPGNSGGLKIKEYKIYEESNGKWKLIGNTTQTIYKVRIPYSLFGGSLKIKVTEVTELGESKGAVVQVKLHSDIVMISLIIVVTALVAVLGVLVYRRRRRQKLI